MPITILALGYLKYMNMNKYLLFILSLFTAGCQYYQYEAESVAVKLVLNGVITNDSVHVHLSKSAAPVGKALFSELWVEKASVQLKDVQTGESYILKEEGKGHYTLKGTKVIAEHNYELSASANSFTTVSAQVVFPSKGDFSVSTPHREPDPSNGNYNKHFLNDIIINDTEDKENYYWTTAIYAPDRASYAIKESIYLKDQCTLIGSMITDKCFNLSTITLKCSAYTNNSELTYEVANTTKEYYEYYKRSNQPEDLDLAFVEPNLVYTNVKNGYGMVIAKNVQKFKFKI